MSPSASAPAIPLATKSLPFLGHALPMWRDPMPFLLEQHALAPVVRLRLGPKTACLVTRPELVRKVLVTEQQRFDKGGPFVDTARTLIGDGLGTCSAADHRHQRPLMNQAFRHPCIVSYTTAMIECAGEIASSWQPGQIVDVCREMRRLACRALTRTLFSDPAQARLTAEIEEAYTVLMPGMWWQMIIPVGLVHRLPLPANRRFEQARRTARSLIARMVAAYRARETALDDGLSTIMSARDATGRAFTDDEVCDQIATLMIGGIPATADLLAWAFCVLSQDAVVEKELHDEVDGVLGGGRLPAFEDIPRLPFLGRVLTETLRLYPSVSILSRRVTRDIVLGGTALRAGDEVMFSPYCLHRDARVFDDPGRFDPDRWLPGRPGPEQREAFIPFGAGTRKCIGDTYGMTEATLAAAHLASRVRLAGIPGSPDPRPLLRMTLSPVPLRLTVEPRTAGARADAEAAGEPAPRRCPGPRRPATGGPVAG
ncbi:cytochrome P450 [Streptomyces sp. AV19]|uniref:cytochrome P450 n=1 Tax=Streptomyces sp. AV19 TaxID=2793068 RepID=UPI0018FEE84D|nr:cytochrome P450 [Streptomyces sp. AV19]MBH1937688.1 cytochrome P450 [Streptomyces sp. AV19]MDG4536356.1 cytochrome P450 [Streptomyces sp. AV19]